MNVGVVGLGTVGYPLFKALEYYYKDVVGYDIKNKRDTWEDILDTDMVFISVGTDKGSDGRLDMHVLDSVLHRLETSGYQRIVVIKSTCRVGYIRKTIEKHSFVIVVFPEWLYAHNAFPGTLRPEMSVIGSDSYKNAEEVVNVCKWHLGSKWNFVTPEEAVLLKLVANGYASAKISFANQIQLICEHYNIDANKIMSLLRMDPRCSPRYLKPGWSYGGYCLPKDTSELEHCCKNTSLFRGIQQINKIIKDREDKDLKE